MDKFFGIDTSNYTTSAACFWQGGAEQSRQMLPVKPGQLGLRQSDAVFHHVQQLPGVISPLLEKGERFSAVGVSVRPRDQEGSYMPCFTVGQGAARMLAQAWGIPCHGFSHQAGHIAAALYSCGRLDLAGREFLAYHVSGGTTEAVLVRPDPQAVFSCTIVSASLDLKGGQAVDRVGGMLGLAFPAGKELERLARQSGREFSIRPSMKGRDFSLSGVENQCRAMIDRGEPREDVAKFCLQAILAALDTSCGLLQKEYPGLPVVFAGGVMANRGIRDALTEKYGAFFADPEFSADNAVGAAVLAAMREGGIEGCSLPY